MFIAPTRTWWKTNPAVPKRTVTQVLVLLCNCHFYSTTQGLTGFIQKRMLCSIHVCISKEIIVLTPVSQIQKSASLCSEQGGDDTQLVLPRDSGVTQVPTSYTIKSSAASYVLNKAGILWFRRSKVIMAYRQEDSSVTGSLNPDIAQFQCAWFQNIHFYSLILQNMHLIVKTAVTNPALPQTSHPQLPASPFCLLHTS